MEHGVARKHLLTLYAGPTPWEISFSRPVWVKLNRLRTSVGLFRSKTHKWGVDSTVACECPAKKQISEHVTTSCPIYHHPNGARALSDVDKNLMAWLTETCPAIKLSGSL